MTDSRQLIRVGHSPDPDDAFMFYALAKDKIDTGPFRFEHELVDIETLNRRAFSGDLELTAVSLHAYAHLSERYLLCPCGASMGDRYGPMVVARGPMKPEDLPRSTIAVPGTLTTAYLALRMCLGADFSHVVVPFDEILETVAAGRWRGTPSQPGDCPDFREAKMGLSPSQCAIDAGLIIHEGQLTYGDHGLHLVLDTGKWWFDETGLPLPLGANAIRKDLGDDAVREVTRLLRESIRYGLDHREEALDYALSFGRGLDRGKADTFVGMYVNDWTLDFGPRGRQAVAELLKRGHAAGVIPTLVEPEFVE